LPRRSALALALALALIAVTLSAAPAGAGSDALARTAWLDEDAPVVVSLRPSFLSAGATLLSKSFGVDAPELAVGVAAVSAGSKAALGVDLLSRAGWEAAGFDPDEAVLISIAAIDDRHAEQVYDKLFSFKEWSDAKLRKVRKAYWRSRAVIRLTDTKLAAKAVRALVAFTPDLYSVRKDNARELAMLLGGSARKSNAIVGRLRKRNFVAMGWLGGLDSVISFRIDGKRNLLLIDVVGSFAGVPTVWTRDSKKLLAVLERSPGNSKLPSLMARGAGASALDSDLAVWLQPRALVDLAKAAGRHSALRALAVSKPNKKKRRELHKIASSEIGQCDRFRDLAARGPFLDAAFTLDLDSHGLRGRSSWGLRTLLVKDDGLLAWGNPKDSVIVAAHYLQGLAKIRALPRPKVMKKGFDTLGEAMHLCGSGGSFVVALFGWPSLIGMALDELRAEDPMLATLIDGMRNGALAIQRIGENESDLIAAAALSFDAKAAKRLRGLVDPMFGKATRKKFGGRPATVWKAAPVSAFTYEPGRAVTGFGGAMGKGAISWFVRAYGPSPNPPIARWSIDAARLVAQLPEAVPDPWGAIADKVDRLEGSLAVRGSALVAEVALQFR
jgi:hypothetical protein